MDRRTKSDKILRDKPFPMASNLEYDGYQGGLASHTHFFDKKSTGSVGDFVTNEQLVNELYKQ